MLSRLMPGILVLGLSYAALLAQPTTLRILALRVEFQTDANPATTGNGRFDLSFPTDPYQIDPPPHNRTYFNDHFLFARNYFEKASRGNLLIEADVFPRGRDEAYQLSRQMGEYNPNTSPQAINQGVAELLRDAVMAADADPLVDFSRYQAVVVFHAGVGRDINLGFDETPQDIPSLYVTSSFLQENLGIDGIPVDGGAITIRSGVVLPETESQEGLQLGLNGILVSNIGSVLGFSDLFSPSEGSSGIGRFGLMDAGLFNGDGLLPAQPCAWTRLEAGWATSETIYQAQGDQFTVRHAGSQAGTTVFRLPINEREYFLVENRYAGGVSLDSVQFVLSQNRNEFVSMKEALQTALPGSATFSDSSGVLTDIDLPDRGLPGSGILIWHIDESVIDANRAENRINDDPDHRGVDLEEADGSQDIGESFEIVSGGAGSEIGTLLDFWFADNPADVFVRDPAGEFSLNSIPDSRSYLNRANSHIRLFNFSARDSVMTFQAEINFFQARFPEDIPATYGPFTSLKTADLDQNGAGEIYITTASRRLLAITGSGNAPDWGSGDPFSIIDFGNSAVMMPPAVVDLPDGRRALVLLNGDSVLVAAYQSAGNTLERLYAGQVTGNITTPPHAEVVGSGNAGLTSAVFGTDAGKLYRLEISGTPVAAVINELATLSDGIKYVLRPDPQSVLAVTTADQVWLDGATFAGLPGAYQPVGPNAFTVNAAGEMRYLVNGPVESSPEGGTFPIDAPPIQIGTLNDNSADRENPPFLAAGNNKLLAYNANLTLRTNFPKTVYQPDREVDLPFAPLAAQLSLSGTGQDLVESYLVSDGDGLITAYSADGQLLPDFPLSAGETLAASPLVLDIDGDGDSELAALTQSGRLYVWDLASPYRGDFWNQPYGNALNSNRQLPGQTILGSGNPAADLLPKESVYNWPNPNQDNFTFIRYRLNSTAEVSIKIFDLAGDLVANLTGTGIANTDNEVRWDLSAVESGVYLARVEARGGGGSAAQMIKIAVVK